MYTCIHVYMLKSFRISKLFIEKLKENVVVSKNEFRC